MSKAYTLMSGNKLKGISNVLNNLPSWSRYPLTVASEAVYYKYKHGGLISQQLSLKPFVIDLVQHKAETAFKINLKITSERIFFHFMLHGSVSFNVHNGAEITKVKANNFYVSHNRPGLLSISGGKGEHIGLVVSVDTDWIKQVATEFDTLKKFVDDFQNLSQNYRVMPHCRMDKQIHQWLREIYTFTTTNKGALDGLLRLYLSLALEHYHKLLKNRENVLSHRVKRYLDKHFPDPDLSYAKLSEVFFTTERTLRNQFKAEFHTTIHDYYSLLRMERARFLIEVEERPVKDVYYEVGYNDESSFRYAYNKFVRKEPGNRSL